MRQQCASGAAPVFDGTRRKPGGRRQSDCQEVAAGNLPLSIQFQDQRADILERPHVIDDSGRNRRTRHAEITRGIFVLRDDNPAAGLDGLDSVGAVPPVSREYDRDGAASKRAPGGFKTSENLRCVPKKSQLGPLQPWKQDLAQVQVRRDQADVAMSVQYPKRGSRRARDHELGLLD